MSGYAWGPGLVFLASVLALYVLPGTLYAWWLLPRLSWLERIVVGFGLGSSAFVVLLEGSHLAFGVPLTAGTAALTLAVIWGPLALRGGYLAAQHRLPRPGWPDLDAAALVKLALLLLVVVNATYWAAFPHTDTGYMAPFHVDEYIHYGNTREMMDSGDLRYPIEDAGRLPGARPSDETGFWIWSAGIAWLTTIPLPQVAMYEPLVGVSIMALAALAYGRWPRFQEGGGSGFGLEATLLVPLIPTTVRLLGPSFYVPMPLVLGFALSAGVLARMDNKKVALPLIVLLGAGGLFIHSATAGVVALVAGWRLLLDADRDQAVRWVGAAVLFAGAFLAIVQLVPFLERYWNLMVEAFTTPTPNPNGFVYEPGGYFFEKLTWPVMVLFGLGFVASFTRGNRDQATLALSLPPVVALIVLGERWQLVYPSVYDRSFFYVPFLVLLLAGAGLATLRHLVARHAPRLTRRLEPSLRERLGAAYRSLDPPAWAEVARPVYLALRQPWGAGWSRTVTGLLAVLLVLGLAFPGVYAVKHEEFYYQNLTEKDYEAFLWIRDHPELLRGADLAMLSPWSGLGFSATTGIPVVSAMHPPHNTSLENRIMKYVYKGACNGTALLEETGAELVYGYCDDHAYLEEVHPRVFLVLPNLNATYKDASWSGWNR